MKRLLRIVGASLCGVLLSSAEAGSQLLPQFPGTDGHVFEIAVDAARNRVYIGGNFTTVGGLPRANLAAIHLGTGAVLPWNPGTTGDVYALAVNPGNGVVYVGGDFNNVAGYGRLNLAAVDVNGAALPSWNPIPNLAVRALAHYDGRLYVGGFFTQVGLLAFQRLVALDAATGVLDGNFDPNPDGAVFSIHPTAAAVYAGGQFANIGGIARTRMAAVSPLNGDGLSGFTANANSGSVSALAGDGSVVYMGGSAYSQVNGTARNYLCAVSPATGTVQPWNPLAAGSVGTVALAGSKLYVAGAFSSVFGQPRSLLAAIDPAGAPSPSATAWAPLLSGGGATVYALAVSGSTVFVGGDFISVEGVARQGFAAINDSDLGPPLAPVEPSPVKPTIGAIGKLKIKTEKAKVALKGTSTAAARIQSKIGKKPYRAVSGRVDRWRCFVRVKPGKTKVLVRAMGPGGVSPALRYTIRRS